MNIFTEQIKTMNVKNCVFNTGDLVEFACGNKLWVQEYTHRSPGIVVSTKGTRSARYRGHSRILWRDGTYTDEHNSYLGLISESR